MWSNILQYLALIDSTKVNIPQPVADDAQLQSILSGVFAVAGVVAVIFIILGGIRYSISQGNAGDLEKAKDMIVYALVGLLFVIIAFTIVQVVTARIFQ
ncbi:MAG: hypothetical protein ABIS24_02870 [Candidatus Saccharimonadales bacterium]